MQIKKDIFYAPEFGERGQGDLYLPEEITPTTATALLIHGGAWNDLSRIRMKGIASFFCEKIGLIVYNINYRLASMAPWPGIGDDCLRAAKCLINGEIPELAICRNRPLFIVGGSAGGHLALMTGLRLAPESVGGIIALSGIDSVREDHAVSPSRYRTLLGYEVKEEELTLIDPLSYLTENSPPILLTHAEDDNVVPIASAKNFLRCAKEKGLFCRGYFYRKEKENGFSHRLFIPGDEGLHLYKDIEEAILDFIEEIRKEKSMKETYIPEPRPQFGPIEISAFYYPGTEQMAEWDMVKDTCPQIKPLLGWYDESNPEVVDWQIKWAVEHGISSFCVDWYWNKGEQRLDHWVKAYYRARFRKYLKWYLMLCNHNEPGSHSTEDQKALTKFWIDNYFKTPEYYKIDGRPVVVIWNIYNLDNDFIAEAAANGEKLEQWEGIQRAFAISNAMAVAAGLPGIHFVAMYHGGAYDETLVKDGKKAGCRETVFYNLDLRSYLLAPEMRKPGDTEKIFSYDCPVMGMPKWWEACAKDKENKAIPLISTGYDDRIRLFQNGRNVYGRTPEKFRLITNACRKFCDENKIKKIMLAPLNEWQEGTYIEPNEEFGFGYYNALRDAFSPVPEGGFPEDLTPAKIGRGPYDYPPTEPLALKTWDFSKGTLNWFRNPFGTPVLQIRENALSFVKSGKDRPAIRTKILPFAAEEVHSCRILMQITLNERASLTEDPQMTLYWGSVEKPLVKGLDFAWESKVSMDVLPDGKWHEYTIKLKGEPTWNGRINEVWLDPINVSFAIVRIQKISFV